MSHPIVLITGETGDAIDLAVAKLEEAGLKVKVLNTGTSKLVDFLAALGDVGDEETKGDKESKEPVDKDSEDDGIPAKKEDPKEPPKGVIPGAKDPLGDSSDDEEVKEGLVDGISMKIGVGAKSTLYVESILREGEKVSYVLNEDTACSYYGDLSEAVVEVKIGNKTLMVSGVTVVENSKLAPMFVIDRKKVSNF